MKVVLAESFRAGDKRHYPEGSTGMVIQHTDHETEEARRGCYRVRMESEEYEQNEIVAPKGILRLVAQ